MELINRLPFPAMAFRQFDPEGNLDCIVSMRGTFMHVQDGSLDIAPQQESFQWEDAYEGDPHASVLLRQSDLTPDKSGTDVTFLGNAYAPDGKPATSWQSILRVGPVSKAVKVHGERHWKPKIQEKWAGFSAKEPKRVIKGWALTQAQPANIVPLCWSKAFGGIIPGTGDPTRESPVDVERRNPLGCGIVNFDMPHDTEPVPAPQITSADQSLDWREQYEPQGFGLVSPWWRSRQQYAGTYDEAWLSKRHPLLPRDFDPRFWQCAHPDLIATPHLGGDEGYQLDHLHPRFGQARGRLPGLTCGVHCQREDRDEWHVLKLDGVHFDWRSENIVMLTWRVRFPLPEAGETTLTLTRVRVKPSPDPSTEVSAGQARENA
ncbi:DUF2169 domain-containing protein [Agrobacterium vitis]|nr:DUF2169 domain-containing protein [Agrobacterium vitis]MCF1436216.1 DUF2169 domain-containing protein [Allorhizobium ampelinum]MUO90601.1 DUF2169 domain-containing protein [Agrobacterium vitis]MUZ52476.1 DUF2169 domain-containing protein [Agrobacterium vitis]MUZ92337.1 DUF2169 domain-containing protein [Agrobacterium vitis]MVA42668.1 DUF2169 domain-containing protein [Agrobacterium vitis]